MEKQTYDNSGWSVSLSSDGSIVAVGAKGNETNTGHEGSMKIMVVYGNK